VLALSLASLAAAGMRDRRGLPARLASRAARHHPGPVASFVPIVLMAVLFGLAMDYEVFLVSQIREDYTRSRDPRHAIIAGGGAAARVVVAAAVIMTCIFASFLLSADTTIKSLALALATGVACDALIVRMTIVPAVLTLAGQHAWHILCWLDQILPDLDIEGTSHRRPPAPRAGQPQAAEGIHQQ
jgi:putative drug exporter of the RND superfamily